METLKELEQRCKRENKTVEIKRYGDYATIITFK